MHVEGSWGPQNSKFSHFCNLYGVICTFSRAQRGTALGNVFGGGPSISGPTRALGGPKKLRTLDNGPEWSPGALGRVSGGPERGSLEVFRGCMGSPGTVLRGLVRVSGGPERVHGVPRGFRGSPKLEILSFLQPLWCDLHVFQGPRWDRPSGSFSCVFDLRPR